MSTPLEQRETRSSAQQSKTPHRSGAQQSGHTASDFTVAVLTPKGQLAAGHYRLTEQAEAVLAQRARRA